MSIKEVIEAVLTLNREGLLDQDGMADMLGKALGEKQEPERAPTRKRVGKPPRESFTNDGVRLPGGMATTVLLYLAENAGTAFTGKGIKNALHHRDPNTLYLASSVQSALTKLKELGLVAHHRDANAWCVSDAGMSMAAAWQEAH